MFLGRVSLFLPLYVQEVQWKQIQYLSDLVKSDTLYL